MGAVVNSPIAALARTCWTFNHDPHDCWFVMHSSYRAYYDASGSQSDPSSQILVSLGVLSNEYQWVRFEREWEELLADFKTPYFRMVEFEGKSPGSPFEFWGDDQCADFMGRALKTIRKRTTMSFGSAVILRDFDAVDKDYRLSELYGLEHPRGGAFAMCSGLNRLRIEQWLMRKKPKSPLVHVFEKGDFGMGALEAQLDHFNVRGLSADFAFLCKWNKRTGQRIRQFEAADLLGWHFRRFYIEYEKYGDDVRVREALREIVMKSQPKEGLHNEASLREFCEKLPGDVLRVVRRDESGVSE